MKTKNFSHISEIYPIETVEFGTIYLPNISTFEIGAFTSILARHCMCLAEKQHIEEKEYTSQFPLADDFVLTTEMQTFLKGIKKPTNLFEQTVLERAIQLNGWVYLPTLFIVDKNGDCLLPFTEKFGEILTMRYEYAEKLLGNKLFLLHFMKYVLKSNIDINETLEKIEKGEKGDAEIIAEINRDDNEKNDKAVVS
jgi:hypothetical protein